MAKLILMQSVGTQCPPERKENHFSLLSKSHLSDILLSAKLFLDISGNEPVRIDNSLSLETWSQWRNLNPRSEFLQAASPMDQGPACPCFSEIEPLQAEAPANSQSQNTSAGSIMMVPKEELLKFPNGGRESSSVNFMNMKSSQMTN
ncbi:hypothetical protein DSO57_1028101 [Entomophthora muscae]|uniref:Uncharacterized protein n=1 Tax=Entomophthora muscae TaxID=34485 RepID=A0ACC2TZP4_9FUNG|nr:hypothetical protein DSO57_1028101 [Entomophthora muscae]